MKKFCALFLCAFMIIAQTIEFIPVNAAGAVDYGEMLNIYLGAAEAALALSQGAEIDISNFEYPEELTTNKEKAQYLMKYYGALRKVGVKAIYDWIFDPVQNPSGDIVSAETAAIGLTNSTGLGPSGIQNLKAQLDNVLATNSNNHILQRYSNEIIARWNEYNTNYINDYIELINTRETPLPNPPVSSLDNVPIFHWAYSNYYAQVGVNYDFSLWYGQQTFNANYPAVLGRVDDPSGYIVGANLTSSNSNVIYNSSSFSGHIEDFTIDYPGLKMFENAVDYINGTWIISSEALVYLQTGISTTDIEHGISISLPDAVIDNSSEDGKIVAHPIYYPDAIINDGAIDIDLDKLIDGIAARIGAGDSSISMDDVVADGAAVKIDGTTLTDADTATADVSVPISAAAEGDLTIPLGQVPPLPNLPPIIPPGGISENIPDGFAGMSVLARIINVTVQSVPAPIIMTFFGVIFGMIVLGIIKILHH